MVMLCDLEGTGGWGEWS